MPKTIHPFFTPTFPQHEPLLPYIGISPPPSSYNGSGGNAMDKTRSAARAGGKHHNATITVQHTFGEKNTLAELIQAYIAEQSAGLPTFGASRSVIQPVNPASGRKEAHE
ncbi:MAG: hypothetical protein IJX53_04875 [Clostridia bacterium]|nr:hypothetical protein [Clostridia bacterium]